MDTRTRPQHSRNRPTRWAAAAGGTALCLGLLGCSGDATGHLQPESPPAAVSTAPTAHATPGPTSPTPTAAPAATPGATAADPALAPAAAPVRVRLEAAGIDVAVLPLTPTAQESAAQSLVPPTTLDGYWLTPYGTPGAGSANTTYIAGHSWEDRPAPFNQLSDPALVGTDIELTTTNGTLDYRVDTVTTYDKTTLKDSDIWAVVPHRLVLISCYTQEPQGKNVVVTATPLGPPGP